MPEPTQPRFGAIPEAPAGGYVIEEGAAAGMRSHLGAEHLHGLRCHVCGGRAEMGKDGRLRFVHDYSRHNSVLKFDTHSALSQPIKRDDEPKRDWWDSE